MPYILLDGVDGCGKSTQVALLAERLTRQGHKVLTTKEPGGTTKLGATLRSIIINPETQISTSAALCLFLADRCQNMEEVRKALAEDKVVISDRSTFSSFVYYAAAMVEHSPLDVAKQIAPLLDFAQQVVPDLCFVCSADFEWSQKQLRDRGALDRIEQMGDAFHKRTHEFFKPYYLNQLCIQMKNAPIKTIHLSKTNDKTPEEISDEIFQHASRLITK